MPNRSGGFWGFWHSSSLHKGCYLQLEQQKLCIKLSVKEPADQRSNRKAAIQALRLKSEKQKLQLEKPKRLGTGETMTIAQRTDYIKMDEAGRVEVEKTIKELKKYI